MACSVKSLVTSGEHLKLYPQGKMETLPALSSKIQSEANTPYLGQTKMFLGFGSAFITASTEQQQV